jgi:hypothetical protein
MPDSPAEHRGNTGIGATVIQIKERFIRNDETGGN